MTHANYNAKSVYSTSEKYVLGPPSGYVEGTTALGTKSY
jgi:hypothetical protein